MTNNNMVENSSFYFISNLQDSDTSWMQDMQLSSLHNFTGQNIPTAIQFN